MSRAPPLAGRYVREYRSSPGAAPRRGAGAGRGRPAAPERALGHRPRKRCHGAGARCARAPHASPGASTARATTAGGSGSGQAVATGACQPGRGTGEPGGAAGRACTGIIGGCGGFACSTPSPAARRAGTFAAIPRHGGCYTAAPLACHGRGRAAAQHAGSTGAPGHRTGAAAPARGGRAALARSPGAGGGRRCAGRGRLARPAAAADLAGAPGRGADCRG